MPSESHTTTDHDEIRKWAEQHGGQPAVVRGTDSSNTSGILRIDFPGGAGEDELQPIEWDEWFERFEKENLAFLYQSERLMEVTTRSSNSSRDNRKSYCATRSRFPWVSGWVSHEPVVARLVSGVRRRVAKGSGHGPIYDHHLGTASGQLPGATAR